MPRNPLADEPGWWYDKTATVVPALFSPLTALYARIASARLLRPPLYSSRLPVVCVGNFTAGGNGKTPLAIHLARQISSSGGRPALLTRGYGGRLAGPHWVDANADEPARVGDEPLLLARVAPTMLARKRDVGAREIERDPRAFTHIVMDDGLQNPSLAKSLAIAVIDTGKGTGNGRVIPSGPLRAPLADQLAITHLIVLNIGITEPSAAEPLAAWLRSLGFAGDVVTAGIRPTGDPSRLKGRRVVALSAIAGPERFARLLAHHEAEVVARAAFSDHHVFTAAEAVSLIAMADRLDAELVTTSKDHARLLHATGSLADLRERLTVVEVELYLAPEPAAVLAKHLARLHPAA